MVSCSLKVASIPFNPRDDVNLLKRCISQKFCNADSFLISLQCNNSTSRLPESLNFSSSNCLSYRPVACKNSNKNTISTSVENEQNSNKSKNVDGEKEGMNIGDKNDARKTIRQPSIQSSLSLLDQFASTSTTAKTESDGANIGSQTIAQQLANKIIGVEDLEEIIIPLGKTSGPNLTISQKRNIRRQDYLNKVAKRNDIPFFGSLALFVILPPLIILGIAIATGYIDIL